MTGRGHGDPDGLKFRARYPNGYGPVVKDSIHSIFMAEGNRVRVRYGLDGKTLGFPDRAPAYRSNVREVLVHRTDRSYTYYLPLTASMGGKAVTAKALLCDGAHTEVSCDLWLCPRH